MYIMAVRERDAQARANLEKNIKILTDILDDEAKKLNKLEKSVRAAEKRYEKQAERHEEIAELFGYLIRNLRRSHKGGGFENKIGKIGYVMREFKKGDLYSSSGRPVTDPRQALAIALSENRRL